MTNADMSVKAHPSAGLLIAGTKTSALPSGDWRLIAGWQRVGLPVAGGIAVARPSAGFPRFLMQHSLNGFACAWSGSAPQDRRRRRNRWNGQTTSFWKK